MSQQSKEEVEKKVKVEVEKEKNMTEEEPEVTDLPGVGASTADNLAEAGFDTVMSIAVATPAELAEAAGGVAETTARKMINKARESLKMGFQSGKDYLEKRKNVKKIHTGSENFDDLLGGGFETGAIIECFGPYGSAKTQLAHALCIKCQEQFDNAQAVYIDTENTFRPERAAEMAKARDLEPEEALQNIKVARAFNSDHQMLLAEKVHELMKDNEDIVLVIVDSLTAHFRAEFVGRGTLAERQQKLNKHMHTLARIADQYNVCVYVTNQVMSKPDKFFGDPTEAIGGNIVAHNSVFRIYLRKGKKGTRVAKLVDSPSMPDGEAIFKITDKGLEDA